MISFFGNDDDGGLGRRKRYRPDPLGRLGQGVWVDDDEPNPFGRVRDTGFDDRPHNKGLSTISQSVGMEGKNDRTDVAVAETLLHRNGVLDTNQTKGPTGYFGMRADQAIRKFQKDRGLKVDGLMLPNGPTIKALQAGTIITPGLATAAAKPQRKLPRLPDEALFGPGGLQRPNLLAKPPAVHTMEKDWKGDIAVPHTQEHRPDRQRESVPPRWQDTLMSAAPSVDAETLRTTGSEARPEPSESGDGTGSSFDTNEAFAALDAMMRKPESAGPSKTPSSDPDRDLEYYAGPHLAQGLRALADLVNSFSPGADIAEAKDEATKAAEAAGKGDVVGTLGHTGMTAAELADTLLPGNASLWAKGALAAVIRKVGVGPFGDRIKGDTVKETMDYLEKIKTGAAADVTDFPGAGKYDVPYGHSGDRWSSGLGWAKMQHDHPEVTPKVLETMPSKMRLKGHPKNPDKAKRLTLEGGGYKATVENFYDGRPYRWVNTFYKPGMDATPGKGRRGRKGRKK